MEIKNKIEWTKQHMPVIEKIREEFSRTKPFKGLTIGACLHLTKETAILLLAIRDGGAKVFACASNPLSTQDDVVGWLNGQDDMYVFGIKGMTEKEYNKGLWEVMDHKPDYIIDDGADLTELILSTNKEGLRDYLPKGGLEETTTGVTRIRNMDLKYPILAVNDADTKHLFDNVHGTGQSTLDGIIRATNILLAGKIFIVAGYGNCGKGLSQRAKGMGCNVIVCEVDPIKALQAYMDGFRVMTMKEASELGDIFVTVTGSKNVINHEHMLGIKKSAILANSGHFDIEIDIQSAKKLGLNVLAEGRLVNLVCAEGHPSEVMDLSFSNQLLGLQYLINNKLEPGVHNVPKEIDEKVARLKLEALGIEIDTETEEQINYRKS